MGSFYTNIIVRHDDRAAVIDLMTRLRRDAYVGPSDRGMVVVYDRESDEQLFPLDQVAITLSLHLDCPTLAVVDHDDDVLMYSLYSHGRELDRYDSAPGYFEGADLPPSGGDVAALCAEFGAAGRHDEISEVLHPTKGRPKDRYVFAYKQHEDLARLLGLPAATVGLGYRYIAAGDLPPGIDSGAFVRTASAG